MKPPLYLLLLSTPLLSAFGGDSSLYDVLSVSKRASHREIRNAYKRLAREWHPDKNKSPEAQEKIMEINRAYEVLSDKDSRHRYDMTGETGDGEGRTQRHAHQHPGFTVFQTGNGHFQFHFGGWGHGGGGGRRSDSVTEHYFFNTIIPDSSRRVFLLTFYTEFCFQCGEVQNVWEELREDLEAQNIAMGSVHAQYEHKIYQYCGIGAVPAIIALVNRRAIHYHGSVQARSIRNFVKSVIPLWTVTELTPYTVDAFLTNSIIRNRPRLILLSPHTIPSLLYKSTAFSNRDTLDFAFISTAQTTATASTGSSVSSEGLQFLHRFGAGRREKKLLLYKEYPSPTLVVNESQLDRHSLRSTVNNAVLYLPRLSSQTVFDTLCETGNRLCLILVVPGYGCYNDTITESFRQLSIQVQNDRILSKDFRLTYIDGDKQREFLKAFGEETEEKECEGEGGGRGRKILLLHRQSSQFAVFGWYNSYCGYHHNDDDDEDLLSYLSTAQPLLRVLLPSLLDEFVPGTLEQLWMRTVDMWYTVYDSIITTDSQLVTVLFTLVLMVTLICCLSVVGVNQENTQQDARQNHQNAANARRSSAIARRHRHHDNSTPPIPLLTLSLYHSSIRSPPRGHVTVVLFASPHIERESRRALFSAAQSYRNRRVQFLYSEYIQWVRQVLNCSNCRSWIGVVGNGMQTSGNGMETGGNGMETGEDRTEQESDNNDGLPLLLLGGAVVMAIFGSRRQFAVFPDPAEFRIAPKDRELRHLNEEEEEGGVRVHCQSGRLVGMAATALSSMGFDSEESEGDGGESEGDGGEGDGGEGEGDGCEGDSHVGSETTSRGNSGVSNKASSADSVKQEGVLRGDQQLPLSLSPTQLRTGLSVWLERLEDGSLRRYSAEEWPQWEEEGEEEEEEETKEGVDN